MGPAYNTYSSVRLLLNVMKQRRYDGYTFISFMADSFLSAHICVKLDSL